MLRLAIWFVAVTAAELPYHSTVVAQGLAASVTLVQLWGLGTPSGLGCAAGVCVCVCARARNCPLNTAVNLPLRSGFLWVA